MKTLKELSEQYMDDLLANRKFESRLAYKQLLATVHRTEQYTQDLLTDTKVESRLIYKQVLVTVYLLLLIWLRGEYSDEITAYLQNLLA